MGIDRETHKKLTKGAQVFMIAELGTFLLCTYKRK